MNIQKRSSILSRLRRVCFGGSDTTTFRSIASWGNIRFFIWLFIRCWFNIVSIGCFRWRRLFIRIITLFCSFRITQRWYYRREKRFRSIRFHNLFGCIFWLNLHWFRGLFCDTKTINVYGNQFLFFIFLMIKKYRETCYITEKNWVCVGFQFTSSAFKKNSLQIAALLQRIFKYFISKELVTKR